VQEEPEFDAEEEYKNARRFMAGPKKSLKQSDMDAIDYSVGKEADQATLDEQIAEKKREYLDGAEDDLREYGIYDSDDEIDFSNFESSRTKSKKQDKDEAPSLFGRLTGAFQNYTGNKTLTKADLAPILKQFSESLTEKNVSAEIAQEICNSVE